MAYYRINNILVSGNTISSLSSGNILIRPSGSGLVDINRLVIDQLLMSALPESTGINNSDLMMMVSNPTGSATTQKITGQTLRNTLLNQPAQLQFRQGTESERLLVTPATGEPIWITDTKKFYIGDGITVGGISIGDNSNYASLSGAVFSGSVLIPSGTGNFNTLTVNNTGVSLSGHVHTTSDITNFNSGVSGLVSGIYVRGTGVVNHISYWTDGRNISADSGQLYWDPTNHRLGVGTGNPSDTIHITDGAVNSTNILIHNSANGYGDKSSIKFNSLTAGGGNSNSALSQIAAGTSVSPVSTNYLDFKVGAWNNNNSVGSTMMRINSNGTVGVGLTNASGILNIVNTVQQDCGPLNISTTGGAPTTRTHIGIGNSDTTPFLASLNGGLTGSLYGWGLFDRSTDGDFQIRRKGGSNSWSDVLHITRIAGNIGIGTVAPLQKLDIRGNVYTSGNIGINTSSPTGALHVVGTGLFSSVTGVPANALLSVYSTVSGATVFNVEGTNGSLFSVVDNLSGSLMSVNNNAGLPVFEVFSNDSVIAGRFGQNDWVVSSGGNVGIGTGVPSQRLHIAGNLRVSGAYYDSSNSSGISGQVLSSTASGTSWISSSGHNHTASQIIDFNEAVDDRIGSGLFVAGTGIRLFYDDTANSFNLSVSGLISNPTNNRVLTSRDNTSTGIDAETYLVFDGNSFTVGNNTNSASNSTIAGGIGNIIPSTSSYSFVGGGLNNNASGAGFNSISCGLGNMIIGGGVFSSIVGGSTNTVSGDRSFLGGGSSTRLIGNDNTICGGGGHSVSGTAHFVGAGFTHQISSGTTYNVIAGGRSNIIRDASYSTIVGGSGNLVRSGLYVNILGGTNNSNNTHSNVFILGSNITGTQANTTYVENFDVALTGDIDTLKINKFYHNNLSVSTGLSDIDLFVTIVNPTGLSSTEVISASGLRSSLLNQPAVLRLRQGTEAERLLITPASGEPIWTTDTQRLYIGDGSTSGGDFIGPGPYTYAGTGYTNIVPIHSTIGYISGTFSNILGGYNNTVSGIYLSISNGQHNTITDTTGTIVTVSGNSTIVNGTGNRIIEGIGCIIGGGYRNSISGSSASVIVGGGDSIWGGNSISGSRNFIGAGIGNIISSGTASSIVGGGWRAAGALNGNVLQSSFCLIGGGDRNVVSTGSHWSSIIGGYNNTISSGCSFSLVAGGANNNIISVTGLSVIVPGLFTATTTAQTIGGGWSNTASALYSTIPGGFRAKTTRFGEFAHAAGFFGSIGDAQHTILVARRTTTDSTSNQILYLDGTSSLLTLSAKTTSTFSIKISAYNDTDSSSAGWIFRGAIKRDGANNTSIVGSVIEENWKDSSMSSAVANVIANDTTESLDILVTGLTSKNIRWVAVIDISQVSYGTP